MEVPKAKIGFKIDKKIFKGISDIKLNIILYIILANNLGDTSDLKEEMLMNSLISYMNANRYILDDYVVIDITIESKYLDEAIKKIKSKISKLTINELDLKRKINSSIASLITNYEDVEQVNNMIQSYIVNYGEIIPNIKEIYENITLEEVNDVISKIDTTEFTVVKMLKDN